MAQKSIEISSSGLSRTDIIVYLMISFFGILMFASYVRAPGEVADSRYFELARSIVEKGSYEFNFRPETMIPPGFPLILAIVLMVAGYQQAVQFHIMALSAVFGLFASYELLRRIEGRFFAAIACLLLASSPILFVFSTRIVFSDLPYFCISMATMVLVLKADTAPAQGPRNWAMLGCVSLLFILAPLVRSVGIALSIALCVWVSASYLADSRLGQRRLKLFVVPLLLAAFGQVYWGTWASHRQFSEWPVPGYPGSYLAQLKVKSGNHPELGAAQFRDFPERIEKNVTGRAAGLAELLTRMEWVNPYWCSPMIFGLIALTLIGWVSSIRNNWGQMHDWYFLIHELMFALWPWDFEVRFLLPIVPLACLYLWRGGKTTWGFAFCHTRNAGLWFLSAGAFLAFNSAIWALHTKAHQANLSVACWVVLALLGLGLLTPVGSKASQLWTRVEGIPRRQSRTSFQTAAGMMAVLVLAVLVEVGVAMELRTARDNVSYDWTKGQFYPDIEAAQWIESHEPPQLVVMARKQDLVFHYSQHRVVWLPPISNPQVLMDGIRKYNVGAVVVSDRDQGYFMPLQEDCFQPLLRAYPDAFHLVHHGPENWIYAVQLPAYSSSLFERRTRQGDLTGLYSSDSNTDQSETTNDWTGAIFTNRLQIPQFPDGPRLGE